MHNPFERVAKVQRRALDAIRLELLAELAREQMVAAEGARLEQRVRHEAAVAAGNWQVPAYPYIDRQQARRRLLDVEARSIDARLDSLRAAAMEACGQMQAVTGAAADFAAEHRRGEMTSEQGGADDFAGTRLVARRPRIVSRR